MSSTVLYLDPWTGISGDMLVASLLDTDREGDRLEKTVRQAVAGLGLVEADLEITRDREWGLACTRIRVVEKDRPPLRHLADMEGLVKTAPLSTLVRGQALAALRTLAQVEAEAHGCSPQKIHFHEVGAVDTLVDIVGSFVLVEALGVNKIMVGTIPVGGGYVNIQHGRMRVPAPATARLLAGYEIVGGPEPRELTTPTGALLLRQLGAEQGPIPAMKVCQIGYGAGAMSLECGPNVLRTLLGNMAGRGAADTVIELETNVDDVSPEIVGHTVQRLREAGALEVWSVPVLMKKDRTGVALHILARPELEHAAVRVLFAELGTLGIRRRAVSRYVAARGVIKVDVQGHQVRVKWGKWEEDLIKLAPEYDDVARICAATGLPFREVMSRGLETARQMLQGQGRPQLGDDGI